MQSTNMLIDKLLEKSSSRATLKSLQPPSSLMKVKIVQFLSISSKLSSLFNVWYGFWSINLTLSELSAMPCHGMVLSWLALERKIRKKMNIWNARKRFTDFRETKWLFLENSIAKSSCLGFGSIGEISRRIQIKHMQSTGIKQRKKRIGMLNVYLLCVDDWFKSIWICLGGICRYTIVCEKNCVVQLRRWQTAETIERKKRRRGFLLFGYNGTNTKQFCFNLHRHVRALEWESAKNRNKSCASRSKTHSEIFFFHVCVWIDAANTSNSSKQSALPSVYILEIMWYLIFR